MAGKTATAAQTETDETATASTEQTAAPATVGNAGRFPLPEGKVTPIQLKNALVQRGLAPTDTKPQMFYTFVKNPGKQDAFPVKHYTADGTEHDSPVVENNITMTRPGLDLEEGVQWWERRRARLGGQATAAAATEGDAQTVAQVSEEQAAEPHGDDETFNEAE